MDQPIIILMTASVDPGPYAALLARSDPTLRLQEYVAALRFWMNYADARIAGVVFCDNSGANLDEVRVLAAGSETQRPVEVLGFAGNDRPVGMHYGFAELGTIDHAVEHSCVIGKARHFAKVTGRLVFPRLSRLLDSMPNDFAFSADCRRAYASEGGPRIRARTQLMLFSTAFFWSNFHRRRSEMIGNVSHIEEFVAAKATNWRNDSRIVLRWTKECPAIGIQGGDQKNLGSNRERAKGVVRGVLRKTAPWLWL